MIMDLMMGPPGSLLPRSGSALYAPPHYHSTVIKCLQYSIATLPVNTPGQTAAALPANGNAGSREATTRAIQPQPHEEDEPGRATPPLAFRATRREAAGNARLFIGEAGVSALLLRLVARKEEVSLLRTGNLDEFRLEIEQLRARDVRRKRHAAPQAHVDAQPALGAIGNLKLKVA